MDARHHLIVAHEVSKVGSDRRQLSNMAKQVKEFLATNKLTVVADRGYYNSEEIRECEQNDIVAYVPKPKSSPNKAKGYFDRDCFKYIKHETGDQPGGNEENYGDHRTVSAFVSKKSA